MRTVKTCPSNLESFTQFVAKSPPFQLKCCTFSKLDRRNQTGSVIAGKFKSFISSGIPGAQICNFEISTSIGLIISFRIISKHFKMYITINDVKGEKTIDLSYPIHSKKEITVVSMHISNSQILLHRSIEVLSVMGKKIVLNKGVYTDKELNSLIGTELKSQMLDSRNDIQRTNKLVNGTKISITLKELDNSDNLKDGKPSNTLFTYFVTSPEYFTHFEPQSPQYKKLKNDTITSLTLAITSQNNDIITDGLETTVVLNIR